MGMDGHMGIHADICIPDAEDGIDSWHGMD
jgi:hypothetical protein